MLESLVYVLTNFPLLLKGVWIAVLITVCSMLLGMVLGIAVAFLRIYGRKPVRKAVSVYEWIFRGLPQLVMLFIVYFGLPELGLNLGPFLSVVLALGLCSSAYQAQIYRGAILSIGSEQMEAGLSLGMTKTQTLFHIILPQAVRLSLPGFTNEFTIVLKDSPLAYAVGITEILKYGRDLIVTSFRPFEIYLACALIYFVLFQLFFYLFKYVAGRYTVPGFLINE